MTLEGAKLICLDEAGNHGEIVLAKGRKFTMGYYVNCDFVLVDERAKGVHCEIESDAFGRVTIRNLSPDKPILVNGSSLEIKRILLNNSKLLILDKEYLWLFPKSSSNEFEDLPIETASTPLKQTIIPEQPPNSCPDFKLHRDLSKRFTVHNFAYCIQSDEEGNTSSESNDESTNADTEANQIENEREVQNKDSNGNASQITDLDKVKVNQNRSITPEPNNELSESTTEIMETPKMNIINCSKDKENRSTQKKNKQLLTMCHQSDVVITSFSPRETGVKIEKSFATIIKPKVLVTKAPLTPKSVYSTPKSDMNDNDEDDEYERDLMTFHTPSTSKKGMGSAAGMSTASTKILKNSSMHLIDLTTPTLLRPASPYLKSALRASAKKNMTQTIDKSRIKLSSDEQLGISVLPATPTTIEVSNSDLVTPSSVISVSSSTDISSVIEVTSDVSNVGTTSANTTGLNTPLKAQTRAGAYTPKKTPHSLMKRALLTSAKKQNTTPQLNTQSSSTPRREILNRKPLRSNLALLGTPVTPKASTGNLSISQLHRRQSMSTPTRKNISGRMGFNSSPSTSNLGSATSSEVISRRSSLIPISAAGALPTSTPLSGSRNSSALRARAACKTSPLHKVRKSLGGVPLSSHISKACRSIVLPGSSKKVTSIKEKSPQQVMSDRLVTRARNSLCVTPISARSRNMAAAAKIPLQSIKKDTKQSAKKPDRKCALFASKQSAHCSEIDNLSRTFIIDSDEEENIDNKKGQKLPKDATFSPEKDSNEMEQRSSKKPDNKETEKEQQPIEIPVDVEEVANITKENNQYECEDKNKKSSLENTTLEKQTNVVESKNKLDNTENNATLPGSDKMKAVVTEESFAEVVNDFQEKNNLGDTIEIVDSLKETVDKGTLEENTKDKKREVKISTQDEANVAETGFGEESIAETRNNENVEHKGNKNETYLNNKTDLEGTNAPPNGQCGQKGAIEAEPNAQANETVLIEKAEETKSSNAQEVELIKGGDEQKSCEYKPIVEDITLEGSVIEKETKENSEIIESKQHTTILEHSLIETKVKDEKVKEEDTKIVIKESTDEVQLSKSTKDAEICEPLEKESCFEPNTDDEANIQQTKEITTNIHENELALTDQIEKLVSCDSNTNELESLESIQVDDNNKISAITDQQQDSHFGPSDTNSVHVHSFNSNVQEAANKTELIENLQVCQTELSELHDSEETAENSNIESEHTNKLLEEIEDVLNKSDEIQQKHLNELEECSDKPLTEEFEQLSEENVAEVEEVKESEKEMQKLEENASNNEKIEETSDPENSAQIIKLTKQEDKNDNEALNLEQEKGVENIEKMDATSPEENSVLETPKSQILIAGEEDSANIISQLKDNTCADEYTELLSQEKSETPEFLKVFSNDNSEDVDKNINSYKEICDLDVPERSESKETEYYVKAEQNIEKFEAVTLENIVSESVIADSFKENSTLITNPVKESNSVNDGNNEINTPQVKSEEQVIDIVRNEQNIDGKNEYNTPSETTITESERKETEQEPNINKLENIQDLEQAKENVSEIADNKELNIINKRVENATSFTPRRSTRRSSQSTDTPEPSAELTFTPRRSARRASMSAESAVTCTPTRRTSRRSSLSVDNETPLTPKPVTKRRVSISIDNETNKPSTSKIQRTKTPRKRFEESMVIPEEMEESTSPALIDNEEDKMRQKLQFEDDDAIAKPSANLTTTRAKTPRKQVVEQSIIIPEQMDEDVAVVISEKIEPEIEWNDVKSVAEEHLQKQPQAYLQENPTSATNWQQKQELSETQDPSEKDSSPFEQKPEIPERSSEEKGKEVVALASAEKTATHNENSEDPQHDNDDNEGLIETAASIDNSDAIEDIVDFIKLQGSSNDILGKAGTEFNEDSGKQYKVDEVVPQEISGSSTASNSSQTLTEDKELTEKFTKSEHEEISTKTPLMSGMRELLKTPKAEVCSPRLVGIRDLVRTPKETVENEEEEFENLEAVADLVRTPKTSVSKTLTPVCKKQVKIVADSPKTPLMTGMRELLKTPKREAQTPRLGGIRNLVLTPKESVENEDEEIEKLAVLADLVKTPELNISEVSKSKAKKRVTILADSPKTPLRKLVKTPKPKAQTSRLGSKHDLVHDSKESVENEDEEDIEKLAVVTDLAKTPDISEVSPPKVNSPKTPLMAGVRELLKTPKVDTLKLASIRNLVQTPKSYVENEQEEIEKLPVLTNLVKTSEYPKNIQNIIEEMPSSSTKNDNLKGVKELLKTPKSCATPPFRGIRELMQTPKESSTPITSGVKELLESPTPQEAEDLPTSTVDITDNLVSKKTDEFSSKTSENVVNLRGVKELLKTPKGSSTPRFKGIKELMQTPKMSSTPFLSGIKELMETPSQQKEQELEKFLRTPAAKNVMIPSMPSSAVIEKSSDDIEVSTEYDLNATNEDESTNLDDLFKTPMTSRFVDRITGSYYGEELDEQEEIDEECRTTENQSFQDTLNKSAEEAFDKLIGQDTQIQTPIRKRYTRKSFTMQSPQAQSPFTAADVLSDMPKTDIEEWIETLEQAEPPTILECDDGEDGEEQQALEHDIINESLKHIEEASSSSLRYSFNDSVIPETCAKVYLSENIIKNKTTDSLTYTETKDPLTNTDKKLNEHETRSLVTSVDAEISGINLLDQTFESFQDEPSMLDEPLVVEEPSMFEEALIVSDDEPEAENALNDADNIENLQDGGNDLSEPLLLSDSEDLSQSQETEPNEIVETENVLEAKDEVLQTSNFDIDVQEKSMLEKLPNIVHSMEEDPLETEYKEDKTLIEIDTSQSEADSEEKETAKDDDGESSSNAEHSLSLADCLIKEMFTNENEEIEIPENVKQENSEIVDVLSTSKITEVLEYPSTSQINQIEMESANDFENNLTFENVDGEIDSVETVSEYEANENDGNSHVEHKDAKEIAIEQTKVISDESVDIFVDSSVTEICEETGVLNEEQVKCKENLSSKKNTKSAKDECQDIFLDNSNIDETFDDEACTKENEATTSATIENNAKDVSLSADSDNNEQENAINNVEHSNEIFEYVKEEDISPIEEVKKAELSQTKIGDNSTDKDEKSEETVDTSLISQDLNQTIENIYELPVLPLQIETQLTEASTVEVESLEKNPVETETVDISKTEPEYLDGKHIEAESSETLVIEQESLDGKQIEPLLDTANKLTGIPTKEITHDTAVHIENPVGNEEQLSKDSQVASDPAPFLSQRSESNEIITTISECELPETSAQEETVQEAAQQPMEDSSTELLSSQAITDTSVPETIELSAQSSLNETEIKNNMPSGSVLTEILGSAEVKNSEINSSLKSEEPEPFKDIDNITDDKVITKNEALDDNKVSPSPNKEEGLNASEKNKIESAKHSEDDQLKEEKKNILANKKASASSKDHKEAEDTEKVLTRETKELDKVETYIEKSVFPTSVQAELTKSKLSSKVVKFEFEVKIVDADQPTRSQSTKATRLTRRNISTEEVHSEITCHTEVDSIKELKSSDAKTTQVPRHGKIENVENNFAEVAKVFPEVSEIKVKAARGKRTVSESSQESTQGDEMSTSSRRNLRKIIEKPNAEKLAEEIKDNVQKLKDTIPSTVKEVEKPKRNRTASESSQGSVKNDDNSTRNRRGGRRKVQKTPAEETVVEQKEEIEEPILQELVLEEQKTEEAKKPMVQTENLPESIEKISREPITESNQELTQKESIAEAPHDAKNQSNEELIAEQNEEIAEVLTQEHKAIANEKQREETEKIYEIQKQVASTEEQISDIPIISISESGNRIESEDHLTTIQDPATTSEKTTLPDSVEKLQEEEKQIVSTTNIDKLSNSPKESSTKTLTLDSEKETKEDAMANQGLATVSQKTIVYNLKEQQKSDISEENIVEVSKTILEGRNTEKPDDVQLPQGSLATILKQDASEKQILEKSSNDEMSNAIEVSEQGKDPGTAKGNLPIIEEVVIYPEKTKHQVAKRGRRKPTVSESSQELVVEDIKSSAKMTRRKVQKTPVEEVVVEKSKDDEGMAGNATSIKTDEINLETGKNPIEAKLSHGKEDIDSRDDRIVSVQTVTVEAQQQTEKRTRRNAAVSVSNRSANHEDDTSRTRRGRRKPQKSPLEEIVIEKENSEEKATEQAVSAETEEIKKEGSKNANEIDEGKQKAETDTNKSEEVTKDNSEKNIKSDVVIMEAPKVESNETVSDLKNDPTSKPEKTIKQNRELTEENQAVEISKDQETTGRRGRNKRTLQETALDEPTTSRKGRRKAQVPKAEVLNAEPKSKVESDIKIPVEDVIASGVPIVIAETDEQNVQKTDEFRHTEMPKELENIATPKVKRGRPTKINVKEIKVESESTTPHTRKSEKRNHQTVEEISVTSHQEHDKEQETPEVLSKQEKTETEMHEAEHSTKQTVKRGRRAKTPATNQITKIDESHKEDIELKHTKAASPQEQKNENMQSHDEEVEMQKELKEKPQKSTRRRGAVKHEQDDQHQEELLTKSRKRRAGDDEAENIIEPKTLSEVKITEVNLEPEDSLDQHKSPKEVKVRKGRKKASLEDKNPEDNETLTASKRKATVKHIDQDHDGSGSSIKTRVGRKKLVEEKHESLVHPVAHTEEDQIHKEIIETTSVNEKLQIQTKIDKPDAEKESKHKQISETSSRSRRNIGRRKPQYKDHDEQIPETKEIGEEPTIIENSGDINKQNVDNNNKHDQKYHDDHIATSENQAPLEETKKGRGRKNKNDHQEEVEIPTTSNSAETKPRGRKRKESHTDINDDHISKEEVKSDEKLIKEPETVINIASASTEPQTPKHRDPVVKKGRKAFEHITAESEEPDDTPGRRARNVPQRRAATVYHNYDETSDSEILSKSKKKTESPRKSLEAIKKSPTATITSASIISVSPSAASPASITTARGRTRKPTAKVQQFLEEERAKRAETPKKRALLAAAAAAAGVYAATPQRTPARRGRKPSTIETEVEGTPQTGKSRGRGRPAALHTIEEPEASVASETIAVVKEKEIELEATPPPSNTVKGRRGGRKAKINEEEQHNSDEPPVKKSPKELQTEKQDSTPSAETAITPTRTAGRRNAAAAAKARIEEDAWAAAAIDPPKRARAKKPTPKVSTPAIATTTDTDAHSSEVEKEPPAKIEKEAKEKTSSQKREHRLTSASTIEGIEDFQNEIEIEAEDKPANKRGRKALASTTTDSPAVPTKRARKPKVVEEVADTEAPGESKASRGRGRGRKNVNLDEHHEEKATSTSQQNATDVETAPVNTSEPPKKITRTRRK